MSSTKVTFAMMTIGHAYTFDGTEALNTTRSSTLTITFLLRESHGFFVNLEDVVHCYVELIFSIFNLIKIIEGS